MTDLEYECSKCGYPLVCRACGEDMFEAHYMAGGLHYTCVSCGEEWKFLDEEDEEGD